MSYPKGKTSVTCYAYEPWHFRYVGRAVAAKVHASGLTPREYLWRQQTTPVPTPTPDADPDADPGGRSDARCRPDAGHGADPGDRADAGDRTDAPGRSHAGHRPDTTGRADTARADAGRGPDAHDLS